MKQAIDDMQPVADVGRRQAHPRRDTQVEIAADPDRLLQVITNLLSNAVKFSPPNSPVSVMLRPGVTGVILSVIDHGRGIPADKLETIFGRFQQVDASDSRQKGGTGLGLAICRTIVMQHSGRIWAERNPVRGSTFRVFLPYQPAPQNGQHARRRPETGHGTVVLADANAETRPRIAAQLARHGYSVVQAANVEQTLSAARQDAQAILLDTSLDGMNGWEILPLLRRLEQSYADARGADERRKSWQPPPICPATLRAGSRNRCAKMICWRNLLACCADPAKRRASSSWKTIATWLM